VNVFSPASSPLQIGLGVGLSLEAVFSPANAAEAQ
jgi:hypothetical protein